MKPISQPKLMKRCGSEYMTRVEPSEADFLTWRPTCHNLERKNCLLYIKIFDVLLIV
ncbi:unnamed protein product [Brassica rapa]|uniref:Uncharacterized protein n=2 Tax=Brassica TaxID=3705 RepID=A0A8D9CU71_BRACM|nr:unnamed protein product [Brassica napus]CAG7864980.1 unnamed protein product [Brassica rapa]